MQKLAIHSPEAYKYVELPVSLLSLNIKKSRMLYSKEWPHNNFW